MISRYTLRRKTRELLLSTVRLLILTGICFVILYPLLLKVSISFMSMSDLYDSSVMFIPKHATMHNFRLAAETVDYFHTLLRSVAFVGIRAVLSVLSSLLVGYGFARFQFYSPWYKHLLGTAGAAYAAPAVPLKKSIASMDEQVG